MLMNLRETSFWEEARRPRPWNTSESAIQGGQSRMPTNQYFMFAK